MSKNRTEDIHADMVESLTKSGEEILRNLTPEKADLWHMGTLASGEAGEMLDGIKKHVVYGKPLDVANIIEELGDLEFAAERIRTIIGVTREEVLQQNIEKLAKRYPGGSYTDKDAQARADKA